VRFYGPAGGYGELVAAVEHDLGRIYDFVNGYGQTVRTRYIISIYGHIRDSQLRGGATTGLRINSRVDKNTVIGYVNNSSRPDGLKKDPNGDGLEHLHLGIRLSNAITARSVDGRFWLRGYEGATDRGEDFAAASLVIPILVQGQ
jgi:murein DD-endopeptidase MepM/ murein hydrolase activator NlpD